MKLAAVPTLRMSNASWPWAETKTSESLSKTASATVCVKISVVNSASGRVAFSLRLDYALRPLLRFGFPINADVFVWGRKPINATCTSATRAYTMYSYATRNHLEVRQAPRRQYQLAYAGEKNSFVEHILPLSAQLELAKIPHFMHAFVR